MELKAEYEGLRRKQKEISPPSGVTEFAASENARNFSDRRIHQLCCGRLLAENDRANDSGSLVDWLSEKETTVFKPRFKLIMESPPNGLLARQSPLFFALFNDRTRWQIIWKVSVERSRRIKSILSRTRIQRRRDSVLRVGKSHRRGGSVPARAAGLVRGRHGCQPEPVSVHPGRARNAGGAR